MDNKHLFYVEILVYPDYRDSFHSIMVEHSKNTLQNEPGCLVFDVLIDDSDPNKFGLFEVYADDASLNFHKNSKSLSTNRQQTDHMVSKRTIYVISGELDVSEFPGGNN